MSVGFAVQSAIEIVVAGFLIWGLFNEQKFVDFEDRVKEKIRRGRK